MTNFSFRWALRTVAGVLLLAAAAPAAMAQGANASALLDKHNTLAPALAKNAFGRPLVLESVEANNRVTGHAYAVLDFPYSTVSTQFKNPNAWCEVMILHLNTKYCRASGPSSASSALTGGETLKVSIGKKTPQTLQEASSLLFNFKLAESSAQFMAVNLTAADGPMSTSDYRMTLEIASLPQGKTFMHLSYAYSYGLAGKLAMQGYLSTIGRSKVGFTQVVAKTSKDATPQFVGGMRGAVERNTMRYYLAMEAYLVSLQEPAPNRLGQRLDHWFTATEQYPEQLREIDKSSYLAMKRDEIQRQLTLP